MPREIDRAEVRRLVADGAQLVEVLPANEYAEDHLPGALSFPLRKLERDARSMLDLSRPVIVYCWDSG
jgi:rhodanese-related sulfurtransferase